MRRSTQEHLTVILMVCATVFIAGGARAATVNFQEVTDNGSGEYAWGESDNWDGGIPTSADEAHIPYGLDCLIDGETAEAQKVRVGVGVGSVASLTMDSGTLRAFLAGGGALRIGLNSDGTFNLNGGTVTVDGTSPTDFSVG